MTYISCFSDFAFWVCVLLLLYILNFLMIKMLQYKMYPAGELRRPTTALVSLPLIQEGQLSVSGERMCTILVKRLED